MRNFILILLTFMVHACCPGAFAALTSVDKQDIGARNLLVNGGFESGKAKWTASAGTFATTTTSPMIGLVHATWDAAASGNTLTSSAVAIPVGFRGRNGALSCLITTASGSATHSIQAYDGTNVLVGSTIYSSTTPTRTTINFVFPSSGNIQLRLYANADEPSIAIDDCYIDLAEQRNISNLSQATFLGGLRWAGAANCTWPLSATTSMADIPADTDCSAPTAYGIATAPGTKIPAIVLPYIPPGKIHIRVNGNLHKVTGASDYACFFRVTDGTNSTVGQEVYAGSNAAVNPGFSGAIDYPNGAGSTTLKVQAAASISATCGLYAGNTTGTADFEIEVYHFPSQSQQALSPALPMNWGVAVWDHGTGKTWSQGSTAAWVTASDADFATRTNYGGAANPASTSTLGLKMPSLPSGLYEVKFSGRMVLDGSNNNANCAFRLYDGTTVIGNTDLTVNTGDGNQDVYANNIIGYIYYSSQADREIVVQANDPGAGSAPVCQIDLAGTLAQKASISVTPVGTALNMPIMVGSVTSNSTGAERIERAKITFNAGTPSVSSQSGTWISSITDHATGDITLNIPAGTFSVNPSCTLAVDSTFGVLSRYIVGIHIETSSATALRININLEDENAATGSGGTHISASDQPFNIICMGPR